MGGGVERLEELLETLHLTEEESMKIELNGVEEKIKGKGG